jgi:hypothetical protein
MRKLGLLLVALIASCGDNIHPSMFVDTAVPNTTLAAGDPVGARCSIVDAVGEPVLDRHGNPLTNSTEFAISYEAPESFATAADGTTIVAAKAGTATVRCSAASLALIDETPVELTIVAGPAVRVITQLDQPMTVAGVADGVQCLVFDAYDNPVQVVAQSIALSPTGAGTSSTANTVTATLAGD